MFTPSIAPIQRLAFLSLFLMLAWPNARAAELPSTAELQYVGPYRIPATMTFNRTGDKYAVAMRLRVPLYQIRFQASGSIGSNTLKPTSYTDTRNGKTYAEARFSGNDVRYGKAGTELQTSTPGGPTLDLFSLIWQITISDGQLPARLHVTNGKKIYPVSGIRKIGEDTYHLGGRDIAIHRYQVRRSDKNMEYAFAPELGNIPVLISYMDSGKTYVLKLQSAKINGKPFG